MDEIKRMQKLAGIITEIKVNNPFGVYALINQLTSEEQLPETLGNIGYHWGTYGNIKGYIEEVSEDYKVSWEIASSAIKNIEEKYEDQIEEYDDVEENDEYDDELDEIKINIPTFFKIKDWVIPYQEQLENDEVDWDDFKEDMGENQADAIWLSMLFKNIFSKKDVEEYLMSNDDQNWVGDADSLIKFLKEYDIIN